MNFKDLNRQEKIEHIIYYYKWHIVLAIVGVLCAISLVYTIFIREPIENYNGIAVYGEFLSFDKENAIQQELADLVNAPENYRVLVDCYYSDENDPTVESNLFQKFNTYLYANQYQLIISNKENIETFAQNEILYPMAAYLTKEDIAEYEKNYEILYTKNPETGRDDAFGIKLDNSALLKKYDIFQRETPYIAFVPQPSEYTERTFNTLEQFLK